MTIPKPTRPSPPHVPTGRELYDAIMGHIDEDLTTKGLQTLEAKYTGETPEQFQDRRKRYVLAFNRFDQAYEGYVHTLQAQVSRYRSVAFSEVEMQDRLREEGVLQSITQGFLPQAA